MVSKVVYSEQLLINWLSRFLGFTKETSDEIYANWLLRPNGEFNPEGGILDYALGHLGMLYIPSMQNLSPGQTLTNLGICTELQSALMDPSFKHIFESQSLAYWLRDSHISICDPGQTSQPLEEACRPNLGHEKREEGTQARWCL